MDVTYGWDATGDNEPHAPDGQGAGYTTGSDGIAWTQAQFDSRPGTVRICQDAGATDATADELDVEAGAATPGDIPGWLERAWESFEAGRRPGQRHPLVYCSASNTAAINAVSDAATEKRPSGLHIAHWGIGKPIVTRMVGTWRGMAVILGVQFANNALWDSDVWATSWLETASKAASPVPSPAPVTTEVSFMASLPTIRQGDKSPAVRTAQGLLLARYYHLGDTGALKDGIDGDFGALTAAAVRDAQGKAKIAVDGIIGPNTWPVLAGI